MRRDFRRLWHRFVTVAALAAVLGQALSLALYRPALAAAPAHLLLDPAAWCGPSPAAPEMPGLPRHDTEHCSLCLVFSGCALPPPEALAISRVPDTALVVLARSVAAPFVSCISPLQPRAPPSVA